MVSQLHMTNMVKPKILTKRKLRCPRGQLRIHLVLSGYLYSHLLRFSHPEHVLLVITGSLLLRRDVGVVHVDRTLFLADSRRFLEMRHDGREVCRRKSKVVEGSNVT